MPVKSKAKISQNFVAFSEYMNFNKIPSTYLIIFFLLNYQYELSLTFLYFYFRPQGEVAPSQEVEFHSRPASILVNLPIHEQESKAEETINVDQLDDLLQTLETIQEDILTQNNKVANIELLKVLTVLT